MSRLKAFTGIAFYIPTALLASDDLCSYAAGRSTQTPDQNYLHPQNYYLLYRVDFSI